MSDGLPAGPLSPLSDGVRIAVRLSPGASRNRLVGVVATPGGRALKAAVAAPPEDGRANEALLRLLAHEWGLKRRDLKLTAGATSRSKVVKIAGDPGALFARLSALVGRLPEG